MRRVVERKRGLVLNAVLLLSEASGDAGCMAAPIPAHLKATAMHGSMATVLPKLKNS